MKRTSNTQASFDWDAVPAVTESPHVQDSPRLRVDIVDRCGHALTPVDRSAFAPSVLKWASELCASRAQMMQEKALAHPAYIEAQDCWLALQRAFEVDLKGGTRG